MSQFASSPAPMRRSWLSHTCRVCVGLPILAICAAVVVNAFALATFQIPTGSMAPNLMGHHRNCTCPRCGVAFPVGRHAEDRNGAGEARLYRKIFCQQCGQFPVPMTAGAETIGDRVLVNKWTYRLRAPARWEVAVFRLFGSYFAKRILGLPGEEIEIRDGDIYINGKLCRKTLEEALAMRVPLYDWQQSGGSAAFDARWERDYDGDWSVVDGRDRPATLTFRNFDIDRQKCEPIRDEYSYNAGAHADSECVHDFIVTCELEVREGNGEIVLQLCDSGEWVGVRVPVGASRRVSCFAVPVPNESPPLPSVLRRERAGVRGDSIPRKTLNFPPVHPPHPQPLSRGVPRERGGIAPSNTMRSLSPGHHSVVLALVDRRLTLSVDGTIWLQTDLPESSERVGVERPFRLQARGVCVALTSFQLHRDVHYGQQGVNGVRGKSVRLGVGQYFVLGDNSPRSEDSRHWTDAGRVPGESVIGPVVRRISK